MTMTVEFATPEGIGPVLDALFGTVVEVTYTADAKHRAHSPAILAGSSSDEKWFDDTDWMLCAYLDPVDQRRTPHAVDATHIAKLRVVGKATRQERGTYRLADPGERSDGVVTRVLSWASVDGAVLPADATDHA